MARPTTHRLLTSLQVEGFLDRDRGTGLWLLGPELYLLGAGSASRYDVTDVALPFVQRLAHITGESAFFSARRGDETVCLLREDGSFPIRSHVLYEGIRFPLGVASAGQAVLAHLSDAEIDAYLAGHDLADTYGPAHEEKEVRERIQQTRRCGYSVNPGLLVAGSWGMGAVVFDRAENPAWALSLTGVDHRFAPDRQPELGALLLDAARQLTIAVRK
nr:IclR family transcriptional regulator [Flexivirga oryzae]